MNEVKKELLDFWMDKICFLPRPFCQTELASVMRPDTFGILAMSSNIGH